MPFYVCIVNLIPGAGVDRVRQVKGEVVGPEDGMIIGLVPPDGFVSAVVVPESSVPSEGSFVFGPEISVEASTGHARSPENDNDR